MSLINRRSLVAAGAALATSAIAQSASLGEYPMPLEKINDAFDLMHAGKSIRSVVLY